MEQGTPYGFVSWANGDCLGKGRDEERAFDVLDCVEVSFFCWALSRFGSKEIYSYLRLCDVDFG